MKKQPSIAVIAMVAALASACAFGQAVPGGQAAAERAAAEQELARLRTQLELMQRQATAEQQQIQLRGQAELRAAQAALQEQMAAARAQMEVAREQMTRETADARAALQEQMEVARAQLAQAARQVAQASDQWGSWHSGPLTGPLRNTLGMTMRDTPNGVVVTAVTPNGPAAEAGIVARDVVIAINDVALARAGGQYQVLMAQLVEIEPGEGVNLEIARGDDSIDVVLTPRPVGPWEPLHAYAPLEPLEPLEPFERLTELQALQSLEGFNVDLASRGWPPFGGSPWDTMQLVTLTPTLGQYFGTDKGILVVRAPADTSVTGLEDGDVILDISGRVPTTPEHTMRILASFEPGETLKIEIMRRERRQSVDAKLPDASYAR